MKARPIIKRNCGIPIRHLQVGEVCQEGDYLGQPHAKSFNPKKNTFGLIGISRYGYYRINKIIQLSDFSYVALWVYRKI